MRIDIHGHNLPGRMFRDACVPIHNVHVGTQVRSEPTDLIPGDATTAEWSVDIRVLSDSGAFDFRGPAVHGRRGERFLYLIWGDVNADGIFSMFRRAKLMLAQIAPELIGAALASGKPLQASIDLTDRYGGPRCGRVDGAALVWSSSE